ncbi:hypothetical protein A2U01_0047958, partial [Trifolium medium]|nr:hypothetical protein [Trifolium medium]
VLRAVTAVTVADGRTVTVPDGLTVMGMTPVSVSCFDQLTALTFVDF